MALLLRAPSYLCNTVLPQNYCRGVLFEGSSRELAVRPQKKKKKKSAFQTTGLFQERDLEFLRALGI